MSNFDNIAPMMGERGQLWEQKKAIEARIKELDEAIRPALADRGEVIEQGYKFKCEVKEGRKTLDKDAVKEALTALDLDLEDFYKVGAPYTELKISKVS